MNLGKRAIDLGILTWLSFFGLIFQFVDTDYI